mgnify:CR=1 FL=1
MSSSDLKFISRPASTLKGTLRVAGDKSISHRSIMLGSLAEGITKVTGFLEGEDALSTLAAFRAMGVEITDPVDGQLEIKGVGLSGLKQPDAPLDMGNSGTSMRLLTGLLSGQQFDSSLIGDESLSTRPMSRVAAPLSLMGGQILTAAEGRPPLQIKGGKYLVGIEYPMPMASAQVKSCILLAGLYAEGETAVIEPAPTRDHTERMLRAFGYEVKTEGARISLHSGGKLTACDLDIPADISSATFFMVAACIAEDADLLLQHVGINPTRDGVITILKLMGADLTLENERMVGGEPVADIRVRSSKLKGIQIPEDQVPLAIDEFPALFIAAACAEGTTVLTGAEELRVKESDRIQVMADGLKVFGIKHKVNPDGIEIQGGQIKGGQVDSHGDHRIAMSFSVAGIRAKKPVEILDCKNVATSFPNFVELANASGMSIETTND